MVFSRWYFQNKRTSYEVVLNYMYLLSPLIKNSPSSDRLQLQVLERNDQNIAYWKNSGVDFPVLGSDVVNYGYGVDINGTIYWPCYKSSGLMFYKVSEEILRWLPEVPQPYNNFSGIAYFGECKGVLRMVVDESMRGATFDMLELKTDHSTWFVKYHIDLTPRATRANPLIAVPILILALLPGEEEGDDPYLILHILKEILSYNLKDGTIRKMYDLSLRPTESLFLRTEPWKYVHPYLQSPTYPTLTASSQRITAFPAWRNVQQEAIANCFRHCKIRSVHPTGSSDLNDVNSGEDIRELENLITGMHYRHEMDVNHLLDYPGENNECYEVQSIEEIVADTIQNPIDDEVEDDLIALEPVTRKEALQAATTLHNFLLQYEKTMSQLLSAVRRFKDEVNIDLKFNKNK